MNVWVVMGNDYPSEVFATAAAAEAYIQEMKADEAKPHWGGPRMSIYWRSYEFEVQS